VTRYQKTIEAPAPLTHIVSGQDRWLATQTNEDPSSKRRENLKTNTFLRHLASGALLMIAALGGTEASFIVDIYQSGSNVVAVGSGTINTSGLTAGSAASSKRFIWASLGDQGAIGVGGTAFSVEAFTGVNAGPGFGSGGRFLASSVSACALVFAVLPKAATC
jgi:hypothetical protein